MLVITFETLTNSAGGPWFDGGQKNTEARSKVLFFPVTVL